VKRDDFYIYAGEPQTNPTKSNIIKVFSAGSFAVAKVCNLKFNQVVSMALSSFYSFSADVPAKVVFFSRMKVVKNLIGNCEKNKFCIF
jgi:hypothetical protein